MYAGTEQNQLYKLTILLVVRNVFDRIYHNALLDHLQHRQEWRGRLIACSLAVACQC